MQSSTSRPGAAWRCGGAVLLVLSLALAGGLGYYVWRDHVLMADSQRKASDRLASAWAAQDPAHARSVTADLPEGTPFAQIQIPRFGEEWSYTILQGVSQETLARGPGHYPASVAPGEIGNFAIAGHRVGYSGVFDRANELQPCDLIVVTTATARYTYKVLPYAAGRPADCPPPTIDAPAGRQIVTPDRSEILNPVPGQAVDVPPREAFITLTTCHPRFSARQRMIIHGVLVSVGDRAS